MTFHSEEDGDEDTLRTLAIYSKNREEWILTDLGCAQAGITTVPIYETMGIESMEYIIN